MISLIDAFKDFNNCFHNQLELSVEQKIELWEKCYISKYPKLEKKLKEDYESSGYDWRKIAEEMVFTRTRDDFEKMTQAYDNILWIMGSVNKKVVDMFDLDLELNIVLYSGLLNSAGWVDEYEGKRAILYGIDKIAELNWHSKEKLESLLYHELGHVIHFELRGEDNLLEGLRDSKYNKGIWRIYEEGFAQFLQYKLLGEETDSRGTEWFVECRQNEKELKRLYLEALKDEDKGSRDFFGDWYKVLNISDAGYYLGAEIIKELSKKFDIKYIARLSFDRIKEGVLSFLCT